MMFGHVESLGQLVVIELFAYTFWDALYFLRCILSEMNLEQMCVWVDGMYIINTTYILQGNDLCGFCRGWHWVEYCRHVKYFPDDKMMIMASVD